MHYNDKVVNVPVVMQRTVPTVHAVQKTVKMPQIQRVDEGIDVPVPSDPDGTVEVVMLTPQERGRQRTVEQAVVVPAATHEAWQPHNSSKQQPAEQAVRERKRMEKEGERRGRKNGRKKE